MRTSSTLVEQVGRDLRYGARALLRRPGFTAVAVITLALAIGPNIAIFTVLYNAVLRPLPYPDSDRLVHLDRTMTTDARGPRVVGFDSTFLELVGESALFESLGSYASQTFTLTGEGDASRIRGEIVSASYFGTLGVTPAIGRLFLEEEDRTPGLHPVAVVSESFWRTRLSARADVIGRVIHLNQVPLTIVGVLPWSFVGESGEASVWIPRAMDRTLLHGQSLMPTAVVGRLREGATAAQADAEVGRLVSGMPDAARLAMVGSAVSLDESRRDPRLGRMLTVLFGAVSCLVLIACANLANLLLARGIGRRRELAVRLALGAGRRAILRQLLTEWLLLALAGGALGLLFAIWSMDVLARVSPTDEIAVWPTFLRQVDARTFEIHGIVSLFTLALVVVTPMLFGAVPAVYAWRADVQQALRLDSESTTGGPGIARTWQALVATEVALAVILLAGAGLMLRSFGRLLERPLGVDPRGIVTFAVTPPSDAYTRPDVGVLFDRLLARIAALPGVESATRVRHLPVRERGTVTSIRLGDETERRYVGFNAVDPAFFHVFRVPLLRGRVFDDRDTASAPPVVVLAQTAARELFGAGDPLGHSLEVMGVSAQIIGVVGDVRYEPQRPQHSIAGDLYVNLRQREPTGAHVALRTGGDPRLHVPALRKILAELDPALPLYDVRTMAEYAASARSYARFTTMLLAVFAALALALALLGIYGTFTYAIVSRRREIGIRMALGAGRRRVVAMVLGEGLMVCGVGLAVGTAGALLAAPALRALLYETSPTDPLALTASVALLAVTACVACAIPARRAASLSPIVAVRP